MAKSTNKTQTHKTQTHKTHNNLNITNNITHTIYKKENVYNIMSMLSKLKTFKMFYKKLNKITIDTINNYKMNDYYYINKYLYNNNSIKDININEDMFNELQANKNINKKSNTNTLFTYNDITISNLPKIIEYYINNKIIKQINILDTIFINNDIPKLTDNDILFRGTKGHTQTTLHSKIGDTLIFKNFMSSSTNISNIVQFTDTNNNNIKVSCCIYILTKLNNIPYLYIPWASNIFKNKFTHQKILMAQHDEFEYVLPRNLKFKITNITKGINTLKNISFINFDKLLNKKHLQSIDNTNISHYINNLYNTIKIYHLEYIEHIPILPIPQYVYDENINIHIE